MPCRADPAWVWAITRAIPFVICVLCSFHGAVFVVRPDPTDIVG